MCDIIGCEKEIREVTTSYFKSIHRWLPTISALYLDQRLRRLHLQPSADMALLLLCMHLVIKIPCHQSDFTMQTQLYQSLKLIFTLVHSAVKPSTEIAQSGLLLSVYEYGHALSHAALQTIGTCSKTAQALGWNMAWYWTAAESSTDVATVEEEKRSWWGILMLDRYGYVGFWLS